MAGGTGERDAVRAGRASAAGRTAEDVAGGAPSREVGAAPRREAGAAGGGVEHQTPPRADQEPREPRPVRNTRKDITTLQLASNSHTSV